MSSPPNSTPEVTINYKTWLKRTIRQALVAAFSNHPDPDVAHTKVQLDNPFDEQDYPTVVVRFSDRDINNAGVGHLEWGPDPNNPGLFIPYRVRLYKGTVTFEIFAMSSLDRDILADAVVESVTLGDVTTGGAAFQARVSETIVANPIAGDHYITLNTDLLSGGEEEAQLAPWGPEDVLVYRASYSMPVLGQFYSRTPASKPGVGLVQDVPFYPYDSDLDPTPTGANDPSPWISGDPGTAGLIASGNQAIVADFD